MKRLLVLLIAAVLVMPVLSAEQKKFKIAVMDVEDQSGTLDPNILKSATEYLRSKLVATGLYVVIDKTRQQEKLKGIIKDSKKESYMECFDKNCQVPLGQALAADNILRSSITLFADVYTMSTELVDLAKEATVAGLVADFDGSPKGMRDAINKIIDDMLAKAQGQAGQKQVEPESFVLQFETSTPGAIAFVDGEQICSKVPCIRDVMKGRHSVKLSAPGYKSREEAMIVEESRIVKWDLVSTAPAPAPVVAPAPKPAPAPVVVKPAPAPAPAPAPKPEPVVAQPEPQPEPAVAQVEPEPAPVEVQKSVPAPVEPKGKVTHPYLWWGIGTLGVAAAVFGVSWYFSAEVGNNLDKRDKLMADYDNYAPADQPTAYKMAIDYEDKAKFNDTMRIVMFSTSGALAIAGTVLAVWWKTEPADAPKVSFFFDGSTVYAGATFSY